jgi:hypothetical protein
MSAPANPAKEQGLSKDQKQKFILAGLVLIVVIGALKMFAYDPMTARLAAAKKTTAELESKVRDLNTARMNAARNHKRLRDIITETVTLTNEGMPLAGNEYAWSARQVFNAAGKLGRRDLEVKEVGRTTPDPRFVSRIARGPYFQAYTATVTQKSGLFELVDLVRQIEQGNEFVNISRLSIRPSENPEWHDVSLNLQWPVLEKPEEFKKQQELAK